MADVPVQLIVAAFADEHGADTALKDLKAAKKEKLIGIQNAAVIRKDADGKLHIKETADMGGGKGAAIGGVTGVALGLLTGGVGLALGALGAVTGGLIAKMKDGGFSDARLEALGDSLQPETSAIVAVIEQKWVAEVSNALAEEGADMMTMNIAADIAQQLEKGNEVAYSIVADDDEMVASRIATGDEGVDASQTVVTDDSIVSTHIAATEDVISGERVTVTDEGEAYETGVITEEGAAYVGVVETDDAAALETVTAVPVADDLEPQGDQPQAEMDVDSAGGADAANEDDAEEKIAEE